MTSGDPVSVTRCAYCGREFDVRRFQVRVAGSRGAYDSTECALLDADGAPAPLRRLPGPDARRGMKEK
jgi:hypothetical protein